jgi:hypothetical protein
MICLIKNKKIMMCSNNLNYDSISKWNRKRFYLRMKDKEKILNTTFYKGRDIGNIEYVIQKYVNNKNHLPFRISYDFKFYDNKWKVDLYSYNVESSDFMYYGKFWKDVNGKWYLGGSTKDYRLYFDSIEYKIFDDKRNLEEWEEEILLNLKYNW